MIAALFRHRSGRIIALCRLVMAFVFFVAVWLDPKQPVRASDLGYSLIASYLAVSVVLLVIATRSWWWDHRLAWLTLVADALAFLAAVFFTEGRGDDFTSPFLAFFTFLMLAPVIDKARLIGIFGKDLLDLPENEASFRELTGLAGQKPWECVGEILEAAASLHALGDRPEWADAAVVRALRADLLAQYGAERLEAARRDLFADSAEHLIPPAFARNVLAHAV